jgi:RNA polymerase sigma factor (sigma-70 family)
MNLAPSAPSPPDVPSAKDLADLRPVVLQWTQRWTTSPADQDDITQEVMLEAEKSRRTNPPVGPLRPWLWVIAARTAARFLRRKQLLGARLARRVGAILRIPSNGPSPEDIAAETNALELVSMLRPALPPRLQAVFSAFWDHHMTHDEIAAALGIPPERSRVYLFQATERLAAAIKEARRNPRRGLWLPLFLERWFRGGGSNGESERSRRFPWARHLPPFPSLPSVPKLIEAAKSILAGGVLGGAAMGVYLALSPSLHWADHLPSIQVRVTESALACHAAVECRIPKGVLETAPETSPPAHPSPATAPTVSREAERTLGALLFGNTHDPNDKR